MNASMELLDLLSDGRFHSGQVLADGLGIARSSVWNRIKGLQHLGLDIQAVRGRGYRLVSPLERLEADAIRAALPIPMQQMPTTLTVLPQVDSTNTWMARHARGAANGSVCLAEQQLAGRGRGSHRWQSPFGRNLYLSILWRLPARTVSGLSIAVGVCVAEACEALGASTIALKWPNDLIVVGDAGRQKLGGILVEVSSDSSDRCTVIIGIGLNVDMPAEMRAGIDQGVIDLNELAATRVSRNALAAQVIERLMSALPLFERQGLAPFRARFLERDANLDLAVRVEQGANVSCGFARGVDEDGALVVETSSGLTRVFRGNVSLRAAT